MVTLTSLRHVLLLTYQVQTNHMVVAVVVVREVYIILLMLKMLEKVVLMENQDGLDLVARVVVAVVLEEEVVLPLVFGKVVLD